jgi:hypothetical protein
MRIVNLPEEALFRVLSVSPGNILCFSAYLCTLIHNFQQFVDDVDLQTLKYVNRLFFRLCGDIQLWKGVLIPRHSKQLAKKLFISPQRPCRAKLVDWNILPGGLVTKRLIQEGRYINDSSQVKMLDILDKLDKWAIEKNLKKHLEQRPAFSDLMYVTKMLLLLGELSHFL